MKYRIEAACGNNIGKIRSNNEDNVYFNGESLATYNDGLQESLFFEKSLKPGLSVAVFDGMGGENFGEIAAFKAAECWKTTKKGFLGHFSTDQKYITKACIKMNDAVVHAAKEQKTSRMGTTVVGIYFAGNSAYFFNVGDSRAYMIRNGEIKQVSEDHVDKLNPAGRKKAPLTQHIGINPDCFVIEPHIEKHKIMSGDYYLLCSDGLTDMLTNEEINGFINENAGVLQCVENLIQAALDKGGRDNITVILCKII